MLYIENNILLGCDGTENNIVVPDGVSEIKNSAFINSEIETITLPDTITKIGYGAFKKCQKLRRINLSSNIISIGAESFWGCNSLNEIDIPHNIDSIMQETFRGCGLKEIRIPKNIQRIYWGGFRRCNILEHVIIEDGIIAIGDSAFEACPKLTTISIPNSVNEIADSAFFLSENISFKVLKGSFAEQYAIKNKINYKYY